MFAPLDPARLERLKTAYSVRNLDRDASLSLVHHAEHQPHHGDLVLAEVTKVGYHQLLELTDGRKAKLYVGDEILVAYGARYAPDHFEAELPDDLGACDLVAAGGVLGKVRSRNAAVSAPTTVRPLGLVGDHNGHVINVSDLALGTPLAALRKPPTFIVVGTSMNSGKTTTCASLVHGLTRSGLRVGAAKLTGTAAGGDPWLFRDSGAVAALDFTDAGMATTFRIPLERLVSSSLLLHGHLMARGVDAIVLEIADGLLQPETAQLLDRPEIRRITNGVLFAAADSSGALYGVQRLRAGNHPVLAVSGLLTASPLAVREAQAGLDVPVYGPLDLQSPALAGELLRRAIAESIAESVDADHGVDEVLA
ncbi:malic enzyme protein [Actinokineospora inagensis]|uniref:malic enzyme protein n=1 Tax=Actinokineospora inagensis TaxID=103730 RepID=UPI00041B8A60|nr:malic enzyme protein [Actinokineospora inagensis]